MQQPALRHRPPPVPPPTPPRPTPSSGVITSAPSLPLAVRHGPLILKAPPKVLIQAGPSAPPAAALAVRSPPPATLCSEGVFRREALEHHVAAVAEGDLLRLDARWSLWTLRVLVATVVVGLLFGLLGSVHEYASGAAIVRVEGRRGITAAIPGTVETVLVRPGQRVAANEVLVKMSDSEERAELERTTTELDMALARLLREPTDALAKTNLGNLRSRRDLAKNQLASRIIRAPIDGVVGDVRVRPGVRLAPGDTIVAIAPKDARVVVVAAVPGDYRPMIDKGAPLRFALDGFSQEYRSLVVEDVSAEAVGPMEVKRFFGQELDGAFPLASGAKVIVTARLDGSTFTSDGVPYGYYDGLTGTADIRVRREPLLVMLIPSLKAILHHD
jgi:multidrug efflux pump subunit AcrA (membrane-fusion protein)